MKGLSLLYWGTVFLMYLSQIYYPVEAQLDGRQIGKRHFMLRRVDIFMIIVIAWMTCFSFLRTSYNDTGTYIAHYATAKGFVESIQDGVLTDFAGNPFSTLYRSIVRDFTDNYHIYFLFPAFLSSLAVVKLFKRYSVSSAFSLLVFFSIGTYVMYIAALKQCLAMFCLLLALPYAVEKKYIRFYLLVFIAILFHTHAFMFAVVPFLFEKPWGKKTWIFLGAALLAMATYDVTLGAFMNYAQSIGAMVAESEVFDGHQINVLRVLVYWIPPLLALFFRDRLFSNSSRVENLFVNMSCISAFILTIGLVQAANLYSRMAAYFEIAVAVALPWMIKKLFTKQSAKIVFSIAVVCYFGYFLYEFAVSKNFGQNYSAVTLWQFIQELIG